MEFYQLLERLPGTAIPYFLGGLAYACWLPVYGPLVDSLVTETGNDFGTSIDKIYSCGAFILTEWEPQVKQTFVKNTNNWDANRVYLDRIEKTYNAEAATLAPTMVLRDEIDFAKISNDILDDWKTNNINYLSKSREDAMWHYFYNCFLQYNMSYGADANEWLRIHKPEIILARIENAKEAKQGIIDIMHRAVARYDRKFIPV